METWIIVLSVLGGLGIFLLVFIISLYLIWKTFLAKGRKSSVVSNLSEVVVQNSEVENEIVDNLGLDNPTFEILDEVPTFSFTDNNKSLEVHDGNFEENQVKYQPNSKDITQRGKSDQHVKNAEVAEIPNKNTFIFHSKTNEFVDSSESHANRIVVAIDPDLSQSQRSVTLATNTSQLNSHNSSNLEEVIDTTKPVDTRSHIQTHEGKIVIIPSRTLVPNNVQPTVNKSINNNTEPKPSSSYAEAAKRPIVIKPKVIAPKVKVKPLRIVVDATPRTIGGYCIDRNHNRVEYYSVPSTSMPWSLWNRSIAGNATEFEMKNLFCALLLWQHLILTYKNVEIYTDNSAIIGRSEYGRRVRTFISHLENCHGVKLMNPDTIYLNRNKYPDEFEDIIGPADSLSRRFMENFVNNIPGFRGLNYEPTIFTKVRQKVAYWTKNSCHRCGFQIQYTGSFKR